VQLSGAVRRQGGAAKTNVTIRYRVFVSSTVDDLQAEREGVDEELSAAEIFEVVRVEKLPATGEPSRRVCLDEIARVDAIVLILGTRYGFIPEQNNPSGLSVTHLEYREGRRLAKPIFAFLRQDGTPEPALEKLIKEVSNFDEGVLRKTWRSIPELRQEVRRSVLFWLAREARIVRSHVEQDRVAAKLAQFPDVGELSVLFTSAEASSEGLEAWQEEFLKQLDVYCRRHLLPLPIRGVQSYASTARSALTLDMQPGSSAERLRVSIAMQRNEGVPVGEVPLVPSVKLEPLRNPEGARFVAKAALGLAFVGTDDVFRGIGQFFTAAEDPSGTARSRENLLDAAAHVSALNKGERSSDVVRRLLELPSLERSTVNAGILCLQAAQIRYENAGARHALVETERLALRLLSISLRRSQGAPELLYNLARQSLKHFPELGLAFYKQLLQSEPSYDERWYFHRDLGLLKYNAGRYRDAGRHYDQASHLKSHDSELWRFAGDAYYYSGKWAEALLRYEKAWEVEPMEECFLDLKVEFARARIRRGVAEEKRFALRRSLSQRFSDLGGSAAKAGLAWAAKPLFRIAKSLCVLNFDADNWLALYANRRRSYTDAIWHLKGALTAVPEDPSTRLNLVVNLIFRDSGEFGEEARTHARIAIFHGGPETRDRFRLRLANTHNREALCQKFAETFENVKREWEAWRERRLKVSAPERFSQVVHMEWRP